MTYADDKAAALRADREREEGELIEYYSQLKRADRQAWLASLDGSYSASFWADIDRIDASTREAIIQAARSMYPAWDAYIVGTHAPGRMAKQPRPGEYFSTHLAYGPIQTYIAVLSKGRSVWGLVREEYAHLFRDS